eukprot:TRINITY_DN2630_c0_g1_i1.p1 TRINITY_DN2630_c0_g1~~TRINITY_DN2630_c0_g1_i1.p1  ORF type:complete len:541 (+),score=121.00 TRINITY_DN2630_c0_g1_i1:150-1772(+)
MFFETNSGSSSPPPMVPSPPRKRPRREGGHAEPDYLKMILTAPVYDVARETPLQKATVLSAKIHNEVWLKREDEQPVFSFKIRGAYNRMVSLPAETREKGVLACSAGNHAQGVALAARHLGIKATICMPTCTPSIKWEAVARYGAEVVLKGASFDDAKAECLRLHQESGRFVVHPYDDPFVIAGQGTIAMEIFRQLPNFRPDAIFCCVGGGGLMAGVLSYTKRIFPDVKVFGCETVDANAMYQSLEKGERVTLKEVGIFADGAAVKEVGEETFRIAKRHLTKDDVVLVSNDEICAAIKDAFEDTRSVLEPAGALALAGAKRYAKEKGVTGQRFVCITSGANMNFDRLRFVSERAAIGEDKEAVLAVKIPEQKGSFMEMYNCFKPRNITEFSYRYRRAGEDAHIFTAFEVTTGARRVDDVAAVVAALEGRGFEVQDCTDNELAKAHARYLVGGRSQVDDERLLRFAFPERAGALQQFLECLMSRFNVSLFHYRCHGSDFGRVLVGMQVHAGEEERFREFLRTLNYAHTDETENPIYKAFLK